VCLALVTFPVVHPSQAATQAHRPDLVVASGHLTAFNGPFATPFTLRNTPVKFKWKVRTKNAGTAVSKTSKSAAVFIERPGVSSSPDTARVKVPKLAPGQSSLGKGKFQLVFDDTWEYGAYRKAICADFPDGVHESKEGNNCRKLDWLYVVPFELKGTVSGSAAIFPGVTESWQGTVTFELLNVPFAADGVYNYNPDVGSLTYTVAGTNSLDGCTWSGMGEFGAASDLNLVGLMFGEKQGSYHAQDGLDSTFSFPVTVTCSGTPSQVDHHPYFSGLTYWLNMGTIPITFPAVGLKQLKGTFTDPTRPQGPVTYSWDLLPQDSP
jgi:hypothetical protein